MSDIEQDKSRSPWELLSDIFREIGILLLVFGVFLDHENRGFKYGIVIGAGGMLSFVVSFICEAKRDMKNKKDIKC